MLRPIPKRIRTRPTFLNRRVSAVPVRQRRNWEYLSECNDVLPVQEILLSLFSDRHLSGKPIPFLAAATSFGRPAAAPLPSRCRWLYSSCERKMPTGLLPRRLIRMNYSNMSATSCSLGPSRMDAATLKIKAVTNVWSNHLQAKTIRLAFHVRTSPALRRAGRSEEFDVSPQLSRLQQFPDKDEQPQQSPQENGIVTRCRRAPCLVSQPILNSAAIANASQSHVR
jgi:hypothetical protein